MRIKLVGELASPMWRWLLVPAIELVGNAQTLAGFISPEVQAAVVRLTPAWLTGWTWYWAAIIGLIAALVAVFEGAYRAVRRREKASGMDARIVLKATPPYVDYRERPADNWHVMFEVVASTPIIGLPVLNYVRPWLADHDKWGLDLLSSIPQILPRHDNNMDRRWTPPHASGAHKFVLAHLEHGPTGVAGERLLFDFDHSVPDAVRNRLYPPPLRAAAGLPPGQYLIQIGVPCLSASKDFVIDWRGTADLGIRDATTKDRRAAQR
jgi:hypothetical protein